MVQAGILWAVTFKVRARSRASPCEKCGGLSCLPTSILFSRSLSLHHFSILLVVTVLLKNTLTYPGNFRTQSRSFQCRGNTGQKCTLASFFLLFYFCQSGLWVGLPENRNLIPNRDKKYFFSPSFPIDRFGPDVQLVIHLSLLLG